MAAKSNEVRSVGKNKGPYIWLLFVKYFLRFNAINSRDKHKTPVCNEVRWTLTSILRKNGLIIVNLTSQIITIYNVPVVREL